MATLRDEAIQQLHRQFLESARKFRFVHCAAIRHQDGSKPLLHTEWCGLLGAYLGRPNILGGYIPVLIDGELGQASCYDTVWELPANLQAVTDAAAEVRLLGERAALEFELGSSAVDPCAPWLEAVLNMEFVKTERRCAANEVFLIRQVPADFFTASAKAIEILGPPAARAADPARKGRSGRKPATKNLARFANTRRKRKPQMTWVDIHVEWVNAHPGATDVNGKPLTVDHVRDAWRREYGDKKPKPTKKSSRRNSRNI